MTSRFFFIALLSLFYILPCTVVAETAESAREAPKAPARASDTRATSNEKAPAKAEAAQAKEDAKKESAKKDEQKKSSESKSKKPLPSDVRVLIDVSGSMKQTDPQNLRKPALDLIVRLLPDKSRAGIWTFGNAVNMLMPFKPVDAAWRKQAAPKSSEINSIAMHTNIGKALEEVSFDRKSLSSDYKTHIILLTDGVVDIGKDGVANFKERQRIIDEIIPNLKSAGYTVHTIALSSDADMDLMKKISSATDGVFTKALSAEQLMGLFLKIFDQAVPAERVPLENNGFLVDASIKEFTALIFRKPGEDKTTIASPEGKEYSATNPNDGINWYRTDKYDLITVDSPKAGQWKIKTEIAPQSRVTVVSNLQLMVDPLKHNLHLNDVLPIKYSFQENGKTIVNKDFLSLIEASAIVAKEHTEENYVTAFTVTTPPADGVFHQTLNNFSSVGDYEVHVFVDGKTFKREFKHNISVRDSLLTLEKKVTKKEDGKVVYSYKIVTDEKIVDVNKVKIKVSVKSAQAGDIEKDLIPVDTTHWEFTFSPEKKGDYAIEFHGQGELPEGDKLDETLTADNFTYEPKVIEQKSSAAPEVAPVNQASSAAAKPTEANHGDATPKEDSSNLLLYIALGIGNLLLVVAGYVIYKVLMGGKTKDELAEFEQTLSAQSKQDLKIKGSDNKEPPTVDKKSRDKTEIDLSDDEPASIPMNEESSMDKLFPLDSMDDPEGLDDDK